MSWGDRSSVNEVICHGIPDKRPLQEGDIVNIGTPPPQIYPIHRELTRTCVFIDVTLYYQGLLVVTSFSWLITNAFFAGYHGDLNETYPVGKIDEESEKLIRVTRECLDAAIAICKPGALFRDIGKVM
jgi:Methionine aminopeptidase